MVSFRFKSNSKGKKLDNPDGLPVINNPFDKGAVIEKAYSRKSDLGMGDGDRVVLSADYDTGVISSPSQNNSKVNQPEISPPVPPLPPPEFSNNPVADEVEYFKRVYSGVFGMDSLIPASRDVLMLNLLFAIYSELVNLRNDLNKE